MWPYTDIENKFYSESKKTAESYFSKAKEAVAEVAEFQVRFAKDAFDLVNKYSGNALSVFEDVFTKQSEEYLRVVSTYTKK